jgi:hypothetical protein
MTEPVYLDTEAVARQLGVQPRTITEYLYRSRLARSNARRSAVAGRPKMRAPSNFPEPDKYYAGRPVWKRSTINRFERQRPGRGAGGGRPRKTIGDRTC